MDFGRLVVQLTPKRYHPRGEMDQIREIAQGLIDTYETGELEAVIVARLEPLGGESVVSMIASGQGQFVLDWLARIRYGMFN